MPLQSVSVEAAKVTVSVRVTAKPTKTFLSIFNIQSFSFCNWELIPHSSSFERPAVRQLEIGCNIGSRKTKRGVFFGVGKYRTPALAGASAKADAYCLRRAF